VPTGNGHERVLFGVLLGGREPLKRLESIED